MQNSLSSLQTVTLGLLLFLTTSCSRQLGEVIFPDSYQDLLKVGEKACFDPQTADKAVVIINESSARVFSTHYTSSILLKPDELPRDQLVDLYKELSRALPRLQCYLVNNPNTDSGHHFAATEGAFALGHIATQLSHYTRFHNTQPEDYVGSIQTDGTPIIQYPGSNAYPVTIYLLTPLPKRHGGGYHSQGLIIKSMSDVVEANQQISKSSSIAKIVISLQPPHKSDGKTKTRIYPIPTR